MMEPFYKRVHVRLIELDRKRPWLLKQTGITPSTWNSWVKFGRIPPADRSLAIADALGVSVEFLVAGRESPFDTQNQSRFQEPQNSLRSPETQSLKQPYRAEILSAHRQSAEDDPHKRSRDTLHPQTDAVAPFAWLPGPLESEFHEHATVFRPYVLWPSQSPQNHPTF